MFETLRQCFNPKSHNKLIETDVMCEEISASDTSAFANLVGEKEPDDPHRTVQELVDGFICHPTIIEYNDHDLMAPLSARINMDEILLTKYPTVPPSITSDVPRTPDEARDILKACVDCTQKYTWECTKLQPRQFLVKGKLWSCPICNNTIQKLERSLVGKSRSSIIRDILEAFPKERSLSRLIFLSLLLHCRHETVLCCGKCSASIETIDCLPYYKDSI